MSCYVFNVVDGSITYELTLHAKKFRADSAGNVAFFDHNDNMIRSFKAHEIIMDSIRKVNE